MPTLQVDPTSPAYLISQFLNVLAHELIVNRQSRFRKCGTDMQYLLKQVQIHTYGQTYIRVSMAFILLQIFAFPDNDDDDDSLMIKNKNFKEWEQFIYDLKKVYKASIRKDASVLFVPEMAMDETEYAFQPDTANFYKLQSRSAMNKEVDQMMNMKLSHQISNLMLRLKFMKAMSIIREELEVLLLEKGEGGDNGDHSDEPIFNGDSIQKFTECINDGSFDNNNDVKEALSSVLQCKKPSELKACVDVEKHEIFKNYWSTDMLKDELDACMQSWEAIVLPLPQYKTMGNYMIPECHNVNLIDISEAEEDGDDDDRGQDGCSQEDEEEHIGEVDKEDQDDDNEISDEENRLDTQQGLPAYLIHRAKEAEQHEENLNPLDGRSENRIDKETRQLEVQDCSDNDMPESNDTEDEDQEEVLLETQPPFGNSETSSIINSTILPLGEIETPKPNLDTQPFFKEFAIHNDDATDTDTASFATAQEIEQDSKELQFISNKAAVSNLEKRRNNLTRNTSDPLESILEIAATATTNSSRPPQPQADDDIVSVDSVELKSTPHAKSTQRTKTRKKRTFQYSENKGKTNSEAGAASVGTKKSATRLFEDSDDDLMADSPSPSKKRTRIMWTEEEIEAVKEGHKKFANNWSMIKSTYSSELGRRTNQNIKDQVRNLKKKKKNQIT